MSEQYYQWKFQVGMPTEEANWLEKREDALAMSAAFGFWDPGELHYDRDSKAMVFEDSGTQGMSSTHQLIQLLQEYLEQYHPNKMITIPVSIVSTKASEGDRQFDEVQADNFQLTESLRDTAFRQGSPCGALYLVRKDSVEYGDSHDLMLFMLTRRKDANKEGKISPFSVEIQN